MAEVAGVVSEAEAAAAAAPVTVGEFERWGSNLWIITSMNWSLVYSLRKATIWSRS